MLRLSFSRRWRLLITLQPHCRNKLCCYFFQGQYSLLTFLCSYWDICRNKLFIKKMIYYKSFERSQFLASLVWLCNLMSLDTAYNKQYIIVIKLLAQPRTVQYFLFLEIRLCNSYMSYFKYLAQIEMLYTFSWMPQSLPLWCMKRSNLIIRWN